MSRVDDYRVRLRATADWEALLLRESGLPGPRANLELVQAVAEEGDEARFTRLLAHGPERAPANSPAEFLALCGVVGLGRLLAEGRSDLLAGLRGYAADPRWRIREGVALALQRLGDRDMDALIRAMEEWSQGGFLEQRAAAAALCEPRLLRDPAHARATVRILDRITAALAQAADRRGAGFKALRQALGYCWSLAVCALGDEGKAAMERWCAGDDPDVRWVMRENLGKGRLRRLDAAWVERWQARLGG